MYIITYHLVFQDMTNKIKEVFRGIPDEFMTSNLASKAKVKTLLHLSNYLFLIVKSQIISCCIHVKILKNILKCMMLSH